MTNILGNIYSREKNYHVFTTDSIGFNEIGLGSYTLSSLNSFLSSIDIATTTTTTISPSPTTTTTRPPKAGSVDIKELTQFFSGEDIVELVNAKLSGSGVSTAQILFFDKNKLEYQINHNDEIFQYENEKGNKITVANSIPDFLNKYDKAIQEKGSSSDVFIIADKINNSLSGCITFNFNYTALGCPHLANIKLRLLNKKDRDNRLIASKGPPIIAGVPTRISGQEYSFRGTEQSQIGVYQNPFEDGINNPSNTVAGELDIRFNKTIGKWQGGTHQTLGRLTTDLEPAYSSSNIVDGSNLAFYSTNSENWIGNFSIGKMMPLSMENGNPYMYGPNFIGCPSGATSRVEELMVVNRSNRPFKKNDIVLASYIEGEWIIQGFDAPDYAAKKSDVGRWQFQKFIVNSDHFFRDERFARDNEPMADFSFDRSFPLAGRDSQILIPEIYETRFRKLFYTTLSVYSDPCILLNAAEKNRLAKANLYLNMPWPSAEKEPYPPSTEYDFILSTNYYQSSIFDQVGGNLGGTNFFGNVISRTNINKSPFGPASQEGLIYQKDLPHFWGPVFPDGYKSDSIAKLKSRAKKQLLTNNSNYYKWFFPQTDKPTAFSLNLDPIIQDLCNSSGMFSNPSDVHFYQLPAEIGLNGSLDGKFSYPIERIDIKLGIEYNNHYNINKFLHSKERFSYLIDSSGSSIFNLTPVAQNIIQFSPLQFQLATSLSSIYNSDGNNASNYNILKSEIETGKSASVFKQDLSTNLPILLSNNFIVRNDLIESSLIEYRNNIIAPENMVIIGKSYIPFGPFVKFSREPIRPAGGPGIIPAIHYNSYEKGNLIGIIAAKNKIKSSSKIINFTTRQNFGLSPKVTIGGSQGPQVTILGAFLSWTNESNPIMQYSQPQWGDNERSDSINSFGTTAMHVRVFDEWPDVDTIYDGRYFSVLHFNPSVLTGVALSDEDIKNIKEKYGFPQTSELQIVRNPNGVLRINNRDFEETLVDFREPTGGSGNVPAEKAFDIGATIGSGDIFNVANESVWRINPTRRGALVSGGGFRYFRKVFGISSIEMLEKSIAEIEEEKKTSQEVDPFQRGKNYISGDIINFPNNAKIEVTSVGGGGGIMSWNIIDSGAGFMPVDFRTSLSGIRDVGGGSGGGAQFIARKATIYPKEYLDIGPKERCPMTRITSASNLGKKQITEDLITSIAMDGGNGKYDLFIFMHNDVLHTQLFEGAFRGGFAQYITLEIT